MTIANSNIPGCGVAVVSADEVLYTNGFGYADQENNTPYQPSTIQNIGSVSKTFIGVSLMKAVELGKLNLEDDINQYLPFEVKHSQFPNQKITIKHLATHSAGIKDRTKYYQKKNYIFEEANPSFKGAPLFYKLLASGIKKNKKLSMEQYFQKVLTSSGEWYSKNNFYKWAPGTQYEYSNIGAALAAFVLEQATGQSFPEFTQQYILDPLGMRHSGWFYADIDESKFAKRYLKNGAIIPNYSLITYPDGGFKTSVEDLSLYFQAMIKGYFSGNEILSKASYAILMSNHLPKSVDTHSGIFWDILPGKKKITIGHSGGDPGIVTYMYFDTDAKLGSIIFFNSDVSKKERATIQKVWDVLKIYRGKLKAS